MLARFSILEPTQIGLCWRPWPCLAVLCFSKTPLIWRCRCWMLDVFLQTIFIQNIIQWPLMKKIKKTKEPLGWVGQQKVEVFWNKITHSLPTKKPWRFRWRIAPSPGFFPQTFRRFGREIRPTVDWWTNESLVFCEGVKWSGELFFVGAEKKFYCSDDLWDRFLYEYWDT